MKFSAKLDAATPLIAMRWYRAANCWRWRCAFGCVYEAYLELALRRQLPLATQDEALRAAALASGVGCVKAVRVEG